MGKRECGVVHDRAVVQQKVEVDDARALGWGGGAVAAHGVLDGEQAVDVADVACADDERGFHTARVWIAP